MMVAAPQVTPVIVRVVHPPTKEISMADLILSGLGVTGLILLGSLLVGLAVGAAFIWFKHRHPENPFNGQASQTHGLHLGGPA